MPAMMDIEGDEKFLAEIDEQLEISYFELSSMRTTSEFVFNELMRREDPVYTEHVLNLGQPEIEA